MKIGRANPPAGLFFYSWYNFFMADQTDYKKLFLVAALAAFCGIVFAELTFSVVYGFYYPEELKTDSEKLVYVRENLSVVISAFNQKQVSLEEVKKVAYEKALLRHNLGLDKIDAKDIIY